MATRRTFLVALGALAATPLLSELIAGCAPPPPPTPMAKWSQQGYGSNVTINSPIELDVNANVSSLTIGPAGVLVFTPGASRTLQSTGNAIVRGHLAMRPINSGVIHTLRFNGVNEAAFVGGGMDPIASDKGLWCMDAGKLDLVGTNKKTWSRTLSGINSPGATGVSFGAAQTGWNVGDELAIAGMRLSPHEGEIRPITSVSGASYNFSPLTYPHPRSPAKEDGSRLGAEVINLTRNVRVEGTPGGRAHVFIRTTVPQNIEQVAFRYMGPQQGGSSVLGRYAVHFHHCEDGSRGSQLIGCVVRDAGSHSYVAHASHAIEFRYCVAQDVQASAFWWDGLDTDGSSITHDTLYDNCGVNHCGWTSENDRTNRGFDHAFGDNNTTTNCFSAGVYGRDGTGSGYRWEADSEAVWNWLNNVAHSCEFGITVWQTDALAHVIDRPFIFNCGEALSLGAYANSYVIRDGEFLGCPNAIHDVAVANSDPQLWQRLRVDGMGGPAIRVSDGRPAGPFNITRIEDCTFFNVGSGPSILMVVTGEATPAHNNHVEVEGCTFPAGTTPVAKEPGCEPSSTLTLV